MKQPVSFAVNVKSNKEAIELQKLAFSCGYKWATDTDYNNIDEHMMQYYGKHTCLVFVYNSKFISFCRLWEISKFSQVLLYEYKNDYKTIVNCLEHYKNYWEHAQEEANIKSSILELEIKERIIL